MPVQPSPLFSNLRVSPEAAEAGTSIRFLADYRNPDGVWPAWVSAAIVDPTAEPGTDPRIWLTMEATAGGGPASGVTYRATYKPRAAGRWAWQIEAGVGLEHHIGAAHQGPMICAGPAPNLDMGPLWINPAEPTVLRRPDGSPILLGGSHTWDNVQDFRASEADARFDFPAFLDFLVGYRHNHTRLWRWEFAYYEAPDGTPLNVDPHPYRRPQTDGPRAADGLWKWDLTQLNAEYYERLEARVRACQERGIYATVMLFEGCIQRQGSTWGLHPFNGANNVNGINASHTLADPGAMAAEEAHVTRAVRALNGYDNLLWEICNEGGDGTAAWQHHMVRLVKALESTLPYRHPVVMSATTGSDNDLLYSPADCIVPGATNYQMPIFGNGTGKPVFVDTDHLWGLGGTDEWVRQAADEGYHPLFMDFYRERVVRATFNQAWDPANAAQIRLAIGDVLEAANGATQPDPDPLPEPDVTYNATLVRRGDGLWLRAADGTEVEIQPVQH